MFVQHMFWKAKHNKTTVNTAPGHQPALPHSRLAFTTFCLTHSAMLPHCNTLPQVDCFLFLWRLQICGHHCNWLLCSEVPMSTQLPKAMAQQNSPPSTGSGHQPAPPDGGRSGGPMHPNVVSIFKILPFLKLFPGAMTQCKTQQCQTQCIDFFLKFFGHVCNV